MRVFDIEKFKNAVSKEDYLDCIDAGWPQEINGTEVREGSSGRLEAGDNCYIIDPEWTREVEEA